ncbi:hypothetical protein ACFFJB_05440 [Camelimonas abortus]|uniref:Uncharacterized protein n=1 Tax=Camelimonas abortus TaxID=1017184 RepID=A0ABV7LG93_9HYPH
MDDDAAFPDGWDPAAVHDAAEAFRQLDAMARAAGKAMTAAFASGVAGGRSLNQVLVSLGARLSNIALNAALRPLESALGARLGSLARALGAAGGGVIANARGPSSPPGASSHSPAAAWWRRRPISPCRGASASWASAARRPSCR